jgi:hypothetical protein
MSILGTHFAYLVGFLYIPYANNLSLRDMDSKSDGKNLSIEDKSPSEGKAGIWIYPLALLICHFRLQDHPPAIFRTKLKNPFTTSLSP